MENDILISHALDKARQCMENFMLTSTPFVDMSSRAALCASLRQCGARYEFFGGYDDAERTICVFLPDYIGNASEFFYENPNDCPISVLRCVCKKGSPPLSHRDFLGSLTALGIKREKIGDILVYDGGADIIILRETEKFLLSEYRSAGRVNFQTETVPITDIRMPKTATETIRGSVASARLDNLIAEAFSLSRESAARAVSEGLVYVNGEKTTKTDAKISEGAKLVLRGMGKAIFCEISGKTRRGRLAAVFERYV